MTIVMTMVVTMTTQMMGSLPFPKQQYTPEQRASVAIMNLQKWLLHKEWLRLAIPPSTDAPPSQPSQSRTEWRRLEIAPSTDAPPSRPSQSRTEMIGNWAFSGCPSLTAITNALLCLKGTWDHVENPPRRSARKRRRTDGVEAPALRVTEAREKIPKVLWRVILEFLWSLVGS